MRAKWTEPEWRRGGGSQRRSFKARLHGAHENEGANGVVLGGKGRRRAWEPRGEGEEEGIRLGWEGRPG